MNDNVVLFPKSKRGSPPNSIDEIHENITVARKERIEMLIDEAMSFAFGLCQVEGFDLTADGCEKTTAMAIESLRAALYKTAGLRHSLFDVADQLFVDADVEQQLERIMSVNDDTDDLEE